MAKIVKIDLENLRFYSYHGFYPEEQVLGNEYCVSLKTRFNRQAEGGFELDESVNYERLYRFASESMGVPRKLLETVADELLEKVKAAFPQLEYIEVTIQKKRPPFGGDNAQASVGIIWQKQI